MIMTNDEYEDIWRELIVPCIRLVSWNFLEVTDLVMFCFSLKSELGKVT